VVVPRGARHRHDRLRPERPGDRAGAPPGAGRCPVGRRHGSGIDALGFDEPTRIVDQCASRTP
jgi:hypothetical protein